MRLTLGRLQVHENVMSERVVQEMLSQHYSYRPFLLPIITMDGALKDTRTGSNKVPCFRSDAHCDTASRTLKG